MLAFVLFCLFRSAGPRFSHSVVCVSMCECVWVCVCVCVCVCMCAHMCVYEIENKPPKGMDFCLDFLTALFPVPRIVAYWKRPWCWKRLRAGGEAGSRGWDGWMASLMWWTWVWANSGRWWRAGKPGVLQSMGLRRVGHNLVTEQQQ